MSSIYIPQLWNDNNDLDQIRDELSRKAENSSIFQLQTDLYAQKSRVKVVKLTKNEGQKICDVDQNQDVFIIGGQFKKTDGNFYDCHSAGLSQNILGFKKLRFKILDKNGKREYMVFLVGDNLPTDWTGDVKIMY